MDIYIAILVGGCTAGICPIETDSASSFFLKLSFFVFIVQFPWFEIWKKVADTFPVQPIYVKFLAVYKVQMTFPKVRTPFVFPFVDDRTVQPCFSAVWKFDDYLMLIIDPTRQPID